jgi:hypothetical protein
MPDDESTAVVCCPEMGEEDRCDVFTFDYRLVQTPVVQTAAGTRRIPVEVKIRARLERCSGPLTVGDLVYSTTLLPGEQVRLFSSDRQSRFTFDTESKVSYRHEQTSEESYYAKTMAYALSSFRSREDIDSVQTSSGSWSGSGKASGFFAGIFGGASASVSGNHSSRSTLDFTRELSGYASSMHHTSVAAVRESSAVQMGTVQSRTHSEGESEDHFESATRLISNPNKCKAVTYLFHQIARTMTVRFKYEAVTRRVIDAAADTSVRLLAPRESGEIHAIPQGVLATSARRLEVESAGRQSVLSDRLGGVPATGLGTAGVLRTTTLLAAPAAEPITEKDQQAALAQVDQELIKAGVLAKKGDAPGEELVALSFEETSSLPTPGILVRACLDECDACEPERHREIELDLERKELENKLLARQIELLDKAQEYRCCPSGKGEED